MDYEPEELPPIKYDEKEPSPFNSTGRILCIIGFLAIFVGAVCAFIGFSAAFSRAGNWSNGLFGLGLIMIVLGGMSNTFAATMGLVEVIAGRDVGNWWPITMFIGFLSVASLFGFLR